jgi:thiamine-monophosphate kinase
MKEFDIIERYLKLHSHARKDVLKSVGDDCALTKVPRGQRLALSMDTLISGVHFLENSCAEDIAHKAVAVNLSDLAAVGAEPAWITLSLSLPDYDEAWLTKFSQGLKNILEYFDVQLIGGDTCRGKLSITIQAHGFVPETAFISRSGAQLGDVICVTGNMGDACLGLLAAKNELQISHEHQQTLLAKYQRPTPRLAAGIVLRGIATSAIDISDGLLADLNHICQQSEVGAMIQWQDIPLSSAAKSVNDSNLLKRAALTGGDDYELGFTLNESDFETARIALKSVGIDCFQIGRITGKSGIRVFEGKEAMDFEYHNIGYQHF